MMNEEVRSIMDSNPKTTNPDQELEELSHYMLKNKVQQLPVLDENRKLVGLITIYDLWKQYENKTTLAGMKVSEVMNTQILKISPKDKIGTAVELFADGRFKTIPVVNLDGDLKGTITAFDVIKTVFLDEYKEAILYKDRLS